MKVTSILQATAFRPRRSCHTAMAYLHQQAAPKQKKMNWVIEGDIVGCFDHIQHKTLMRLLKKTYSGQEVVEPDLANAQGWSDGRNAIQENTEGTPKVVLSRPCSPTSISMR